MKILKAVIITLVIVAIVGVSGWKVARIIKPSVGYDVQAEFTQLPPNDEALESWFKLQSGVVEHTVHIERQGNVVHVMFITSRDLLGDPPFPNFQQQAATLGYRGSKQGWVDVQR